MLDRYPQLYQLGLKNEFFNVKAFWGSTINSFYHSVIVYYGVTLMWGDGIVLKSGTNGNNWLMGSILYGVVLFTVTWKAALITEHWTKFAFLAIFGSLLVWIVLYPIIGLVETATGLAEELDGIPAILYASSVFWLCVILLPVAALLFDFTWK